MDERDDGARGAHPGGWAAGPLLGFDTETTGVEAASDRIVSAALVDRRAGTTATRTWLIDPGVAIPDDAAAVHGITTEHVRAGGEPASRALADIAARLAAASRAGTPVVAYNAPFDLAILDAELRRHGHATLRERLGRPARPVLDPLVLDRALQPDRDGPRRLADLCAAYGVDPGGALHAADVDARATLALLLAIGQANPALARWPADQVHAWQVTTRRARAQRRRGQRRSGPGAAGQGRE